jgi:hypothetical protein
MLISPQCPLVFVHIMKTGGMSVLTGLGRNLPASVADLYNVSASEPLRAASAVADPQICAYAGHFNFGLHEFLTRPSFYFSIVRRPVERVLSLYLYLSDYRRMIRSYANVDLQRVLNSPATPDLFADFSSWIIGPDTLRGFLDCPSAEVSNGMVRRLSGIAMDGGPCPAEALEVAKSNIERYFSLVGVQERYAETLALVRRTFEWPELEEHRTNVTRDNSEFNEQARAYIAGMNQLDLELYDFVVQRFEHQLQNPSPPIAVPPGCRTDFEKLPMWRAVGESPVRAAMVKPPKSAS